jgi:hypothetical protein
MSSPLSYTIQNLDLINSEPILYDNYQESTNILLNKVYS